MAHSAEFCIFTADPAPGPRQYTREDLQSIADNFGAEGRIKRELNEDLMPPVVIGHEEDQQILKRSDLPAAGWISDVWLEGDRLMAKADRVPDPVRSWIDSGLYRTRSAEIYRDYKGKGPALRRLALLGADVPHKKDLGDLTWTNNAEETESFDTITQHKEAPVADEKTEEIEVTEINVTKHADAPPAPMQDANQNGVPDSEEDVEIKGKMKRGAAPAQPQPMAPVRPPAPAVPVQRFSELEEMVKVQAEKIAHLQAEREAAQAAIRKQEITKFAEDAAREGYWTGDTTTRVIEGLAKCDGVERFAEGESTTDVVMQLLKAVATKQQIQTAPLSAGAAAGETDDFAELKRDYDWYLTKNRSQSPLSLEKFAEANGFPVDQLPEADSDSK